MSNKYSSNSVSEDFPLYHNENIPIYSPHNVNNHHKNYSNLRIMVSNEHPDIFRIKGIKEGGYINPHLKEVLKVDREEYYKKINDISKKIKLIDLIKSSRKYSQDPKYLSLINNDDYIKKKKFISFSPINNDKSRNKCSISLENNKTLLNSALTTLNKDRIRFLRDNTRKNIDLNKMKKIGDNFIINQDDINKIKTINCDFNPDKSSYMANSNNYKILESLKENDFKEKSFLYPRKPIYKFNPISNSKTLLNLPPYIFPKWTNFSENYFVLDHTKKGFRKKGGLFTEFVNKNFDKIKVVNDDIRKSLKKIKDEEEKGRNKNIRKIEFNTPGKSLNVTKFKEKKNSLLDRMKQLNLKNRSYVSLFEVEK